MINYDKEKKKKNLFFYGNLNSRMEKRIKKAEKLRRKCRSCVKQLYLPRTRTCQDFFFSQTHRQVGNNNQCSFLICLSSWRENFFLREYKAVIFCFCYTQTRHRNCRRFFFICLFSNVRPIDLVKRYEYFVKRFFSSIFLRVYSRSTLANFFIFTILNSPKILL